MYIERATFLSVEHWFQSVSTYVAQSVYTEEIYSLCFMVIKLTITFAKSFLSLQVKS